MVGWLDERLRAIVEAAVYAEELGFAGVGIGEHHFHGYIVSAPELLLAAVAARTTRLRLGTAEVMPLLECAASRP